MVLRTNDDKVYIILIYGEFRRNLREAVRLYFLRFPNRPSSERKIFISLCAHFKNYGRFKNFERKLLLYDSKRK